MYKRKTKDCWDFYQDYGQGWECVNSEATYREMKVNKKAYLENSSCPLKIIKRREKINESV